MVVPFKRQLVVFHIRVSTDKQEDSPERQLSLLVPYAERKGYEHVGTYTDLNQKGWKDDRPEFQRMLADARRGRFDLILVDQGSRLSRQTATEFFALVAYPLTQAGVQVESVQRGRVLDWNDVGDFIVQSVDQFRSHGESADISWRVLSEWCLKAQRAEVLLGAAPYGYRRALRPEGTPTLEPGDDRQVQVVQFVFQAYGRLGWSLAEIAQELKTRGALTPKGGTDWRRSTLARWLRDPVYIGTYRFNVTHYGKFYRRTQQGLEKSTRERSRSRQRNEPGDWIVRPNNHAPLVEADLFYRVQELLTHNKRGTTPGRQRRDFLLAGLLVCDHCGCRMTGHHQRRAGNSKVYRVTYRCASSYEAGRCLTNTIHEDEIRGQVLGAIRTFASPANLARLRELARERLLAACSPGNLEPLHREKQQLQKQVERARRNLSLLADEEDVRSVSGDIAAWRARIGEIDALAAEAERPAALARLEEVIAAMESVLWDLGQAEKGADPRTLRLLLVRLVKHVRVRISSEVIGKNRHRYHVEGGEIQLNPGSPLSGELANGLLNLSSGGASTGQVGAWTVQLRLPA